MRGVRFVGLVVATIICCVAVAMSGCSPSRPIPRDRTLAAVLIYETPSRLLLVDLESGDVVSRATLRSGAIDLDVDPRERLVMTAQCGGVAGDADDVVGVYDVDDAGKVTYVSLGYPNPGGVTHLGPRRTFFANGWTDKQGVVIGLMDPVARKRVAEGRVPGLSSPPTLAGGALWGMAVEPSGEDRLVRIDPETLETTTVASGPAGASRIMGGKEPGGAMYAVTLVEGRVPGVTVSIKRFDGTARSLESTGLSVHFDDGPGLSGVVVGDTFAIADFTGVDSVTRGGRVLLVPKGLGSAPVEVEMPGSPAALSALGDDLVVLERHTGRILRVDVRTRQTKVLADLDGHEGRYFDMAILPGSG